MRWVLLVLMASMAWSGCDPTEVTIDGGASDDAGTGPAGRIVVESESTATLRYGEAAALVVRYLEGGSPRPDVALGFALSGMANDAALDELEAITDGDGRVSTRLVAGTVRSVFRVRVSAERAPAAWIDVSVSDAGFGELRVEAVYDGARAEYARRVITVYAGIECSPGAEYPASAIARQTTLDDATVLEVPFRTLPAGLSYTVVGVVEGATGAPLATACMDGLEVNDGEATPVVLSFEDATLIPAGTYEVELAVSADAFGAVATRGVDAALAVAMPEADELLSALEDELRARGLEAEADALAVELATGLPARDLQRSLTDAGADPAEGLRRFFARLLDLLERVRVSGPLEVTYDGADTEGVWDATAVTLGMGGPDEPSPLFLDEVPASLPLRPILDLLWKPDSDTLEVQALSLSLPLGALMVVAIEAALLDVTSGPGGALLDAAGCDALASWVAADVALGAVCDEACVDAACVMALGAVFEAAEAAVLAEPTLDSMTVGGLLAAFDDDGDLAVDRLEGTVIGAWAGTVPASSVDVSGSLGGPRARPPG